MTIVSEGKESGEGKGIGMGFSFRWLERHEREGEYERNGFYPEDTIFLPKHGLKGIYICIVEGKLRADTKYRPPSMCIDADIEGRPDQWMDD